MALQTITGPIFKSDNTPWVGVTIFFRLDRVSVDLDEGAVFPPDGIKVITDEDGDFSQDLWANANGAIPCRYFVTIGSATPLPIMITEDGATDLPTLLAEGSTLVADGDPVDVVINEKIATHAAVHASSTQLGHFRVGSGLSIDGDGILSVDSSGSVLGNPGVGLAPAPAYVSANVIETITAWPAIPPNNFVASQTIFDSSAAPAPSQPTLIIGTNNVVAFANAFNGSAVSGIRNRMFRGLTATGDLSTVNGLDSLVSLCGAGAITHARGVYSQITVGNGLGSPQSTISVANLIGAEFGAWVDEVVTATNVTGVIARASNHNTDGPSVGTLIALQADADVPRHTNVAIGINITANNGTAATTAYGLKIDGIASATTPWGIYVNGTWKNYFAGSLGLGTAPGAEGLYAISVNVVDGAVLLNSIGLTLGEAKHIMLGTTTGTQIGTATAQKLGFWGATPVAQQIFATGTGKTVDNVITFLQTLGLCRQS